jgi:hypothetical protein
MVQTIKDLYHTNTEYNQGFVLYNTGYNQGFVPSNTGYNQGFVPYKYWIQSRICTIQILDTIKDLYLTNTGYNQGFVPYKYWTQLRICTILYPVFV